MDRTSRIYIAGHRGLVGSALLRELRTDGFTNLLLRAHSELDLTQQADVEAFFAKEKPEYVFLAAAKVGGIWANNRYPVDFLLTNLKIQNNVIGAAWRHGTKGLLFLGSSCIYLGLAPQPLKEEYLLTGPLERTNEPYAIAKIAGIELCEAYNRQYGTLFLCVMPTNLYGPYDNYDLVSSHVVPALIRKFHLAKLAVQGDWDAISNDQARYGKIPEDVLVGLQKTDGPVVRLWGSGSPKREFLYVDDMADACLFLMKRIDELFSTHWPFGNARHLINIGSGKDLTISELAEIVAGVVGFDGSVESDSSKPDGTPRKLVDTNRLISLGWQPKTSLKQGILRTYQDYLSSQTPLTPTDERKRRKVMGFKWSYGLG